MISAEATHDLPGRDGSDPGAEYLDTITLLEDEISRLESELQARREDDLESRVSPTSEADAAATALLQQSLDRTRDELAARDETISFLLEQVRLIEDAESASRAEWEQLAQWVSEVEERVEGQDLARERGDEEERERYAAPRLKVVVSSSEERKTWAAERHRLEEEAGRLQALSAAPLRRMVADNRAPPRLSRPSSRRTAASAIPTGNSRSSAAPKPKRCGRKPMGRKLNWRPCARSMSWSRTNAYASAESTRRQWRRIALQSLARPWRRARQFTSPTRARRRQTTRSRWMSTCESERSAST